MFNRRVALAILVGQVIFSSSTSKAIEVDFITEKKVGQYTIKFEEPVIFLDKFSGEGDEISYLGLRVSAGAVMISGDDIYLNLRKLPLNGAKEFTISSDFSSILTRENQKARELTPRDKEVFYSPNHLREAFLPDKAVVEIVGQFGPGSSGGLPLSPRHLYVYSGNLVVKVWGDDLYISNRKVDLELGVSQYRLIEISGITGKVTKLKKK